MPLAVGVLIRRTKELIYCDAGSADISVNSAVLVETENGMEAGVVMQPEQMVNVKGQLRKIARLCTAEDFRHIKRNKEAAQKLLPVIIEKIENSGLKMNLSMVEYTFERMKLFIYYTADERVDFRDLLKELGPILKTRIQMVQIGVRDEVKILGSLGHCGQICCCQRFLKDFTSVTGDMAKEQNLTVNPAKISGVCGRLMCCLAFEHCFYADMNKKMPRINSNVMTPDGKGKVFGTDIFKSEVTVQFNDGKTGKYNLKEIK
ncbi:MAG: hypothetical protein BWY26_00418 [Elusimicrobia bacterium ADurb.Bin231]|nr:MAG: hypothetical protein BWY26_00418 [Elusimicrobia bacterium ADurb.Bin231]